MGEFVDEMRLDDKNVIASCVAGLYLFDLHPETLKLASPMEESEGKGTKTARSRSRLPGSSLNDLNA